MNQPTTLKEANEKNGGEGFAVTIDNKFIPGTLYADTRIDKSSLPKDLHAFGIRKKQGTKWIPCAILKGYPNKNFLGTFVTSRKVDITIETTIQDYQYFL